MIDDINKERSVLKTLAFLVLPELTMIIIINDS